MKRQEAGFSENQPSISGALHAELSGTPSRHDLAKISYSPQTDAALTNFKTLLELETNGVLKSNSVLKFVRVSLLETLLELETSLLMVCDTKWAGASDFAEPVTAAAAGAVLNAARQTNDNDGFSNEDSGDQCDGAAAAAGPAHGARPADYASPPTTMPALRVSRPSSVHLNLTTLTYPQYFNLPFFHPTCHCERTLEALLVILNAQIDL
jgi:hypothetical protein